MSGWAAASGAPSLHSIDYLPGGSGSFGCIASTQIPCVDGVYAKGLKPQDALRHKDVSVVKFEAETAGNASWVHREALHDLDPTGDFLLPLKAICKVNDPALVSTLRKTCPVLNVSHAGTSTLEAPMEIFMDKGYPFLSEQYIKDVPFEDTIALLIPLFDGVARMDAEEVVHGDIKPENVLFFNHDGAKLKLIDFDFLTAYDVLEPLTLKSARGPDAPDWRARIVPSLDFLKAYETNGLFERSENVYFPPETTFQNVCYSSALGRITGSRVRTFDRSFHLTRAWLESVLRRDWCDELDICKPAVADMFNAHYVSIRDRYTRTTLDEDTDAQRRRAEDMLARQAAITSPSDLAWRRKEIMDAITREYEKLRQRGQVGMTTFYSVSALVQTYAPDKHAAFQMGVLFLRVLLEYARRDSSGRVNYKSFLSLVNMLMKPLPDDRMSVADAAKLLRTNIAVPSSKVGAHTGI